MQFLAVGCCVVVLRIVPKSFIFADNRLEYISTEEDMYLQGLFFSHDFIRSQPLPPSVLIGA